MAVLRVGTSGYSYKEWRGSFYPEKLPDKQMLGYYSQRLATVEINYTFYQLPSARTPEGWVPQTPDGFLFALKANQKITGVLRLRNTETVMEAFLTGAAPLAAAGRLGPLLLQLPPQFRADPVVLKDFLTVLPERPVLRWAMEFRHPSWFDDATLQLLEERGVALCVAETDERSTPDQRTAPFAYFRLRKTDYSPSELHSWRERFEALQAQGCDVYVYFKHEAGGAAPRFAAQLLEKSA